MTETLKIRKQRLYEAATKARNHFLAVEGRLKLKAKKEHPELEWFKVMELVEQDPEYIRAEAKLLAICEACNIMGVESGR